MNETGISVTIIIESDNISSTTFIYSNIDIMQFEIGKFFSDELNITEIDSIGYIEELTENGHIVLEDIISEKIHIFLDKNFIDTEIQLNGIIL